MRERERERDAEQGDTSNSIKNCCFNDFETCESIRIVRRQNHDSYMNRFLRASLVFSSSSLKQRSMAPPPLLRVPGGGVYLGP